jgi:MraZ protein
MSRHFFSGCTFAKLDSKKRFVLPQAMRNGLVEDGELKCTIALGLGGCLAIYRRSAIDEIVERFRAKQHVAKYQKFFTLFFSTLYHTTCDAVGRLTLPESLKQAAGIQGEIAIAGVMNKIEIWPKEVYDQNLAKLMFEAGEDKDLQDTLAEAFALLEEGAVSVQPTEREEALV